MITLKLIDEEQRGRSSGSDSASSEVIGIGTRPARPANSVTNSSPSLPSADTVDGRPKNFLTQNEIDRFLVAAKKGRYGERDYCAMLLAFRHGLRASELTKLRMDSVDLDAGRIFVGRKKGSMSTSQPMAGDEIRAVRAWLRKRSAFAYVGSVFLFITEREGELTRYALHYLCGEVGRRMKPPMHVHPHMLRHSCGYALANMGRDTRLIQDWLGHRNIVHTELYTRTSAKRFEGIWNDR